MSVEWGGNESRKINPDNLHNDSPNVIEQAMLNMGNLSFKIQDSLGLLEHDPTPEETASRGEKLFVGLQVGTVAVLGALAAHKYGL